MTSLEKKARDMHRRKIARNTAAELLGMGHQRFEALLKEWGLDWPDQIQAERVTFNGKTATFAEHAKTLGLSESTLRSRHRNGIPLDAPGRRTITVAHALQFAELRYAGLSGVVAASRVGFHYNHLHKMAKEHAPDYVKKLKTLPRRRRTQAELNQIP